MPDYLLLQSATKWLEQSCRHVQQYIQVHTSDLVAQWMCLSLLQRSQHAVMYALVLTAWPADPEPWLYIFSYAMANLGFDIECCSKR